MTEVQFFFDHDRDAPIVLPADVLTWLEESGAEVTVLHAWWPRGSSKACAILGFESLEDSIVFKMRWHPTS